MLLSTLISWYQMQEKENLQKASDVQVCISLSPLWNSGWNVISPNTDAILVTSLLTQLSLEATHDIYRFVRVDFWCKPPW